MVIDEDGQRSDASRRRSQRRAGDVFVLDEQMRRIVEILPEVSTMVAYNAVWVATPNVGDDEDERIPAGVRMRSGERASSGPRR